MLFTNISIREEAESKNESLMWKSAKSHLRKVLELRKFFSLPPAISPGWIIHEARFLLVNLQMLANFRFFFPFVHEAIQHELKKRNGNFSHDQSCERIVHVDIESLIF